MKPFHRIRTIIALKLLPKDQIHGCQKEMMKLIRNSLNTKLDKNTHAEWIIKIDKRFKEMETKHDNTSG